MARITGKNSMMSLNPISRQRVKGNFQGHSMCSGKVLLDRMQKSAEEGKQTGGNNVNNGIY